MDESTCYLVILRKNAPEVVMSSPGEELERRMSNEREETEIENQSPSSQPLASPSKIPASLSAKTKDELAELLVSTLRQLKARDQRLKELNELSKTRDAEREERLEREKQEEQARQQGEETRQKQEERYMAELAALKEKHGALQKQHEDLVRQRAEEAQQQRASSEEELSTLRKSQAKLKKAVVELKKRNESLDVRHKEAEVARCTMADELSKAEAQIAAFSEYKQKAHALLKAKDEEIRNGTEAIREAFEAELGMEKAARREAEVARDAAVEELGTVQSQVAAQIRDLELQHEDQLVRSDVSIVLGGLHPSRDHQGWVIWSLLLVGFLLVRLRLCVALSVLRHSSKKNSSCRLPTQRIRRRDCSSCKSGLTQLNSGTSR